MFAVQLAKLGTDLAPDTSPFRRVFNCRRAEIFESMVAASREKLVPALHVAGVTHTRMPGFQLQRVGVGRLDDGPGIDRSPVSVDGFGLLHSAGPSTRCTTQKALASCTNALVFWGDEGPDIWGWHPLAASMIGVALLAAGVPARRAARVNPIAAL